FLRIKNAGLVRTPADAQHSGNFLNSVAFHCRKQKDQPQLLRQFREGIFETRLEFIRSREVFGGRRWKLLLRLRPKRVSQFAPFPRTQTVQRQTKRDSHQPGAEAAAVAKSVELPIRTQQSFLSYVFRIRGIAQNAAGNAIGKRAALGEALLELAPSVSLGCLVRQLPLLVMRGRKAAGRATWLDQNQLLHLPSCARFERPPSACN